MNKKSKKDKIISDLQFRLDQLEKKSSNNDNNRFNNLPPQPPSYNELGAVGYVFQRPISGRINSAYSDNFHNYFPNNIGYPPPQSFEGYNRLRYPNPVQNIMSNHRSNSCDRNNSQRNGRVLHDIKKEQEKKQNEERRLREEKFKEEKLKFELEKQIAENRKIEQAKVETATRTMTIEETLTNERIKGEKLKKRRKEIAQLLLAIKEASKLDICFLIDCTGSMNSYIEEVKNKIIWLKNEIIKMHSTVDAINFAFVGYRDICNGSDNFSILPFTQSVTEFEYFVKSVGAFGGCSHTADVLGGLNEVSKLHWTVPMTKIMIHICDVSGHGKRFHYQYGLSDPYPEGDPNGLVAENLLPLLKNKIGISNYVFMRLTKYTDVMMSEFEKILGTDAKEWLKQITLESALDLMPKTLESVSSGILTTESSTITGFANKRGALKEFELDGQVPDWEKIHEEQIVLYFHKLPIMRDSKAFAAGHVDVELLRKNFVVIKKNRVIKIASKPFAKGGMRLAYYGIDVTPFSDKNESNNFADLCVLKEFLHIGNGSNSKERYIDQIEIQALAMHLAIQFNKVKPKGLKDVKFLKESVIAFYERKETRYFTKEKLIKENYTKFNNNWGYVNEKEFHAILQAFSHWTYNVTNGFLQVVDLQGIRDGDTFMLTDPVIHCEDVTRFGKTNLGHAGMDRFFMSHICNVVCVEMDLKKHQNQKSVA